MEPFLIFALGIVGYAIGSVKIINEGNMALVERLGQYQRTLKPGLHHVIPVIESVLVETTREQVLDIEPKSTITRDNVSLTVDAVMYWKILDIRKAYYTVENLEEALRNLVITTLRSEIGRMELRETVSSRSKINQALLHQLDEATETWGVKVMRVEVEEITPSKTMLESLELERAAESKRKAAISETEGTVESIQRISKALQTQPNAQTVMNYLLAQRYVDANYKLGESPNSKIIFMDPKALSETIGDMISSEGAGNNGNDSNTNGRA
ncbi:MAG TPA: stomatin-like protein [Thermosynechococcaceae cyanobacterium]